MNEETRKGVWLGAARLGTRLTMDMSRRPGMRVLLGIGALLGVLFLASAVKLAGGLLFNGGGRQVLPIPVRVATVTVQEFVDSIEAIGTARANESVEITAKVTETIRQLNFSDGQLVASGQVLAELIDAEQSADLAEARAALTEAEKQFERSSDLARKGTVSRSVLDTQRAQRDSAQARVEALEARLEDRIIRAPFAGVLGLRAVSPGTLLRPGDRIVTLDDISVIKVDFAIPETFVAGLEPGLHIIAKVAAYPDRAFKGVVRAVDTRVDPVSRSIIVRAEIPNTDGLIRPGMLITVDLLSNKRRSLAVPEEALIPLADRLYVLVVADKTVERREVTIGGRRPGVVEVLDGLKAGDSVVVEGTATAIPGEPVKILDSVVLRPGSDQDTSAR